MKEFKVFLREDEIPKQWYNIQADLPTPLQPPLHPGTGKPIGPQDLAPVFPMNLIEQEVSKVASSTNASGHDIHFLLPKFL